MSPSGPFALFPSYAKLGHNLPSYVSKHVRVVKRGREGFINTHYKRTEFIL